jgi:hypothetical protein
VKQNFLHTRWIGPSWLGSAVIVDGNQDVGIVFSSGIWESEFRQRFGLSFGVEAEDGLGWLQ